MPDYVHIPEARRGYWGRERPGTVYVIWSNGLGKIGSTRALRPRLQAISTGHPDMFVVHAFEASDLRTAEWLLHRHFAHLRRGGESFELGRREVEWIRRIQGFFAGPGFEENKCGFILRSQSLVQLPLYPTRDLTG